MSTVRDYRIRLVCKLRPGKEGLDNFIETLRLGGWSTEGKKFSKKGFEAEILTSSLREDEVIVSTRFSQPSALEDFVRSAIQSCWYIDVYYHLRGDMAEIAAKNFEIPLVEKRVHRKNVAGVDLRLEAFPSAKALTISYRIGWGELNKGVIGKVHGRIMKEHLDRSWLDKISRWRR